MAPHPDAQAFLTRLIAEPSDTVMRLIFADWLDMQGNESNTNWASYLRLQVQAQQSPGSAAELYAEEAANLAPTIRAKVKLSANRLRENFLHYAQILPPELYEISLKHYEWQPSVHHLLSLEQCLASRSIIIAEFCGAFAAVSTMCDPFHATQLAKTVQGKVIQFGTTPPQWQRFLRSIYPELQAARAEDAMTDVIQVTQGPEFRWANWVATARKSNVMMMELIAQPTQYELRWQTEGHTRCQEIVTRLEAEELLAYLEQPQNCVRLGVRTSPRNLSFGPGVTIVLRPS